MNSNQPITMYQACMLHARADRALRLVVAQELEQYKVTMMEWLLLGVVINGPSNGLSMSAIARELDVTLPQVTALVTNLIKHKLVKQKTQTHDRRSRHVIPTVKGADLLERIEESIAAAMKSWVADVPKDKLQTYLETVKILATK